MRALVLLFVALVFAFGCELLRLELASLFGRVELALLVFSVREVELLWLALEEFEFLVLLLAVVCCLWLLSRVACARSVLEDLVDALVFAFSFGASFLLAVVVRERLEFDPLRALAVSLLRRVFVVVGEAFLDGVPLVWVWLRAVSLCVAVLVLVEGVAGRAAAVAGGAGFAATRGVGAVRVGVGGTTIGAC